MAAEFGLVENSRDDDVKIIAHLEGCPALCQLCGCSVDGPFCEHAMDFNGHAVHVCTCDGAAKLKALMEAAEGFVSKSDEHVISEQWLLDPISSIDETLEPFRDPLLARGA